MFKKKKEKKKTIFWKWKILDSHRNAETIQVLYVTHGEEFDLEGWKVAPIQQRLSKERTSLIFLFLLHYYRVYIPFCQLVIICHNLSQLLLICLQSIFEVIKHSIAHSTCCKLALTQTPKVMHHWFSLHLITVLFLPEPSLCNSFRLALFATLRCLSFLHLVIRLF